VPVGREWTEVPGAPAAGCTRDPRAKTTPPQPRKPARRCVRHRVPRQTTPTPLHR